MSGNHYTPPSTTPHYIMSTITYNPYTSAFSAAREAFTCPEASAYFSSRALADADRVLTVFNAVFTIANFVYEFGAQMGAMHYAAVSDRFVAPVYTQPRLMPAVDTVDAAVEEAIASGDVPEISDAEAVVVDGAIAASHAASRALIESLNNQARPAQFAKMTKKALLAACRERGVKASHKLRKAQIIEALLSSY